MKSIYIVIVCLVSQTSWSQKSDSVKIKGCKWETIVNEESFSKSMGCMVNGKKEGYWYEYAKSKEFITKSPFKNNIREGKYFIYYWTGELREIGTYKNNTASDTIKTYKKNGEPIAIYVLLVTGFKSAKVVYRKYFDKEAKPDGTFETANGKKYMWNLGERREFELKK